MLAYFSWLASIAHPSIRGSGSITSSRAQNWKHKFVASASNSAVGYLRRHRWVGGRQMPVVCAVALAPGSPPERRGLLAPDATDLGSAGSPDTRSRGRAACALT